MWCMFQRQGYIYGASPCPLSAVPSWNPELFQVGTPNSEPFIQPSWGGGGSSLGLHPSLIGALWTSSSRMCVVRPHVDHARAALQPQNLNPDLFITESFGCGAMKGMVQTGLCPNSVGRLWTCSSRVYLVRSYSGHARRAVEPQTRNHQLVVNSTSSVTQQRYAALGSNIVPRRVRPIPRRTRSGLAGLRPHRREGLVTGPPPEVGS